MISASIKVISLLERARQKLATQKRFDSGWNFLSRLLDGEHPYVTNWKRSALSISDIFRQSRSVQKCLIHL